MRIYVLLGAAMMLLLSGCAALNPWEGDYACKGYPEGVRCKSAREVYEATNYRDALEPNGDEEEDAKDEKGNKDDQDQPRPQSEQPGESAAAVQGLKYYGPMPLRSPARIIRIWVAPWESQEGILHLPAYLYAEVDERRWQIGESRMEIAPRITPLEVQRAPEAAVDSKRRTGRRTDRQPAPSFPSLSEKAPPKKVKNDSENCVFDRNRPQLPVDNSLK